MMRNPESPYLPVGLLDDDPDQQRLSIRGVPCLGARSNRSHCRSTHRGHALAHRHADRQARDRSELAQLATGAGLVDKVLPPVGPVARGCRLGDIRDRHRGGPARPAPDRHRRRRHRRATSPAKRVLVTGAGGRSAPSCAGRSTGSRPRADHARPRRVRAARGRSSRSTAGRCSTPPRPRPGRHPRRRPARSRSSSARRPQVVFHAAALKHLPLLERAPGGGVQDERIGHAQRASRRPPPPASTCFVNISTDKAADPISVLGYTKRIAERLTAGMSRSRDDGTYLSVRFGNVLGCRGQRAHHLPRADRRAAARSPSPTPT